MGISNFFGKNSSSKSNDWEKFESGAVAWEDFSNVEKEHVVRHYASKIRFIAVRLKSKIPKNIELSEMISAGSLGLLEALGKFEPGKGVRFETYAENRIRGAMLDDLRKLDWFSRTLRRRVRQIDEAMRSVEQEQKRSATEHELQEITGLSEKEVRSALEALQHNMCISLDAIKDTVAQDSMISDGAPYEQTMQADLIDKVSDLIDTLTDREKMVLSLYYNEELSMREAASVLGVTEGRVSQLHTQALARLRREFLTQYGSNGI